MNDRTDQEILDMLYAWTKSLVPELSAFIERLAELEPEIGPIIAEHIRDNNEMLPTVLMGDIARWVVGVAHESDNPRLRLAPFFAELEDGWGDGQNAVSDLIAVAFVENIFDEPEVVNLLGPELFRYYRIYTGQEKVRRDEVRPMPEVVKKVLKKLGRR
ncbi:hypothetical protein BJY24_007401 [Nocardia transvalensis]|uniref:DUF7674 domain-containing protein n=1 Tax=Nocardia transvalensis TaxID=37333 RepID=A0A7W9PLR2_9NOCA|nr:hypothetical protein [Nocardia transvalensis]MBB5918489.1 hypothetical protein [Nocardia transvalensis]